jgi:peptidoglycan/xylan/chitin deacetylase (PgdA/CDA1 family)
MNHADGCVYATLWPAVRLLRRKLYPPPRPNEIALTFDDGPNPECTPRLLDILGSRNIKAAFFVVGKFAVAHPQLVRRIVKEGHVIGNHSWSHPNLASIPLTQVREELQRTSSLLEQIIGNPIRLFRPPYGACNAETLSYARNLGMMPVFWNAMTADWEERPPSRTVEELTQQIERNRSRRRASCIVLHDGRADNPQASGALSVEAAAQLIGCLQNSYSFVSIQTW